MIFKGRSKCQFWLIAKNFKVADQEREHKPSTFSVFPGSRLLSQYLSSIKQLQFSGQRMGEEHRPFEEFWRHEKDSLRCLAWRVNDRKASDWLRNSWQEGWLINPEESFGKKSPYQLGDCERTNLHVESSILIVWTLFHTIKPKASESSAPAESVALQLFWLKKQFWFGDAFLLSITSNLTQSVPIILIWKIHEDALRWRKHQQLGMVNFLRYKHRHGTCSYCFSEEYPSSGHSSRKNAPQ